MQRPRVVLPHPLSPTIPNVSPRAIEKSTPSTALIVTPVLPKSDFLPPKCFLISLTSMIGKAVLSCPAVMNSAPLFRERIGGIACPVANKVESKDHQDHAYGRTDP